MIKLLAILLVVLPYTANSSILITQSFELEVSESYGEIRERKSKSKQTWTFSSDYGIFVLVQEPCNGCVPSDESSISDFMSNPNFSEYGAILVKAGGKVGSLTYLPTHKNAMVVLAEFLHDEIMISLQLVTKEGLTAREVQHANVELMMLLNSIKYR